MTEKINTDALLASVKISSIIGDFLTLKQQGQEFIGICPFHEDSKPSLSVNDKKGVYKCFSCGAGGDAIDFLTRKGKTFKESIEYITNEKYQYKDKKETKKWVYIIPEHEPETFKHYQHGEPSMKWKYTDQDGNLLGYTCRFDLPDGKKDILPFTFATDGKRKAWRYNGFAKPRPLYNLQRLKQFPEATVLIVEGEKTADFAQKIYKDTVVVTWIGGGNNVENADWQPLHGRKVVFWPDNDAQGEAAMIHIYCLIGEHIKKNAFIKNAPDFPKGWDVADASWSLNEALKYIRSNFIPLPNEAVYSLPDEFTSFNGTPVRFWELSQPDGSGNYLTGYFSDGVNEQWKFIKKPEVKTEPPKKTTEVKSVNEEHSRYFRFLGYAKNESNVMQYYFYSFEKNLIVSISSTSFTTPRLIDLAPLDFWAFTFQAKSGFDLNTAINWLMRKQSLFGMFDERRVRGRGAWLDNKRIVLHCGSHLVVNGEHSELNKFKTSYMYEQRIPLGIEAENPIVKEESKKILDMLKLVNWERDINAYLLAGWIVIAPICGVLKWRPHVWVTGGAGTGKTWVSTELIRPLLGEIGLFVQGETTEAGVRQTLVCDALPVVFDEAESETQRNADRVQNILGLMRQASSDDGGIIIKGSSSGIANTFRIRSTFCLSSIAVGITQQADRTRVSVLGIKKLIDHELKQQRWTELQKLKTETINEKYCEGIRARTINLIPVILNNIRTFSAAAASEIGDQRTGDQLGVLLAGAFSLISDKEITYENAVKWIREKDWNEEKGLDSTRDEMSCFAFIMEHLTNVEITEANYNNEGEGRLSSTRLERTIGELLMIAGNKKIVNFLTPDICDERLRRLGIKVSEGYIVIANNSIYLKKVLSQTNWASNYHKILARLEGSKEIGSTSFGAGTKSRAVKIPFDYLESSDSEVKPSKISIFDSDEDVPF